MTTLAMLVKPGVPDLKLCWEVGSRLLQTLERLHAEGAVHGNLTPSSLLIGPQGEVTFAEHAAAAPNPKEPAYYDAPEQFAHGESGARTDLYQAGAILYQLATGRPPFSGSAEEVAHLVREQRPQDPSAFQPKAAWQLDWVLQRALSKDPADRFGTAREFLEGLRLGMQETLGMPLTLAPAVKPVAKRPPAPAAEISAAAAPTKLMRVLFVDDEERILTALRILFRNVYDVYTAADGAEAFELLERHAFHIVVSDQRMPGFTGVELLREVKRLYPRTVRLLLSGYSDLQALVGSINEGEVFRYIRKPWDNDEIRATLEEAAALVAKFMPALPKPKAPRAGSLMVIEPGRSLANGVERLIAGAAKVHRVTTARDAAKILQTEDVAAVIADLKAGKDGLIALFKLLKAKRPETFSILVADEADAELVADLINHAHVFKFLPRPVEARELRTHVSEALRRYAAYKEARAGASGLAQGPGASRFVPNPA